MIELKISSRKSKTIIRIRNPHFRIVDFDLFKDLCGRITWTVVLARRELQEKGLIFRL